MGGSIYHHSGRHYAWELAQTALSWLLGEVLPYMQAKRKQAELILELVKAKENGGDREHERRIVEQLRRLNVEN